MSTAEKMKVDATRAAETVRAARDTACAAAARCRCTGSHAFGAAPQTSAKAHEAKGAAEAKSHSTTERVKEARHAASPPPLRPLRGCVSMPRRSAARRSATSRTRGAQQTAVRRPSRRGARSRLAVVLLMPTRSLPWLAPAFLGGTSPPQMAHDAKESISHGLHKVGEKLHIVEPEKKI